MKKLCQYCGRIHDKKFDCGRKPPRKRWARQIEEGSRQAEIRSTNQWTLKSLDIRERDHHLCQACLKLEHRLNYKSLSVHHIVPLAEDESLAFDDENLVTLCARHHEEAEKGQISRETLRAWAKVPPG